MVVHPAPGHAEGTLVNALLGAVKNLSGIGGELRPGIVHRLDKGTSGVVLVAKNDRTHRALAAQFAGRSVEKTYLALAWGVMDEDEGVFEAALGRDVKDRKKISVRSRRARPAVTRWKVLKRLADATLLEVHPETGRTHQIRVHLATALHPVLGDPEYGPGGPRGRAFRKASIRHGFGDRLALHAWRIAFAHPTGKIPMEIVAPPPPELVTLLPETKPARKRRAEGTADMRGGLGETALPSARGRARSPSAPAPAGRRGDAEVRSGRTPQAAPATPPARARKARG
jgi:23S rRNA pseudouridine1911/1915/1917 synthase